MLIPLSTLGNVASLNRGIPRFGARGFGALGDGPFGPNFNAYGDPITPAGAAYSAATYAALQQVNQADAPAVQQAINAGTYRSPVINAAPLTYNPQQFSQAMVDASNAIYATSAAGDVAGYHNALDAYNRAALAQGFPAWQGAILSDRQVLANLVTANAYAAASAIPFPGGARTASGGIVPSTPSAPPVSSSINPGRVTIANTTRPGQQSFYPSDSYIVQISGATPNQPVTAAATQNGKSLGTTPFGNTDTAGNFSISGTMSTDQIGNWVEVWMVAGLQSGTASFSVIQSPGATPAPTGQTTTPPDPTATGGTTAKQQPQPAAPASSSFLSFLTQGFQIGSLTIPFWAVGVGLIGAFAFGEKGGN